VHKRVSVVIVSFEVRECLRRCLTALGEAGGALDVWVVDNASSDGSADMVAEEFPAVRLLRHERNLGFAVAANRALREGQRDYALLLNPDAELRAAALERLVRFLDLHPHAAVVAPRLLGSDGRPQRSAWSFPQLTSTLLRLVGAPRRRPGPSDVGGDGEATPRSVDWVSGACVLVRRTAMAQVGLLDEAFFLYGEDVDWCRRFWNAGWSVWLDPSITAVHLGGQSAARLKRAGVDLWTLHSGRNDYLYFRKHRGARAAALITAVDCLSSALRWAKWATLAWLFRNPAWRVRARVQRRKVRDAARVYG
jgi:GT2 family glycosyltransferase